VQERVTKHYRALGRLLALRKDGALSWVGTDHLGSTVRVAQADFAPLDQLRYVPFGGPRDPAALLRTDHRFTSQVRDQSLGLDWYRSRAYDPALGRFTCPDTLVPNPANPQDLNRYSYTRNNPLRHTDPSGHVSIELWFKPVPQAPFANHAFLLVTDLEGVTTFHRAGPDYAAPAHQKLERPFGSVHAESGEFVPKTVDYTTTPTARVQLLLNDEPADAYRGALHGLEARVNESETAYAPPGPTSNTFARAAVEALEAVNADVADVPSPPVLAPGWHMSMPAGWVLPAPLFDHAAAIEEVVSGVDLESPVDAPPGGEGDAVAAEEPVWEEAAWYDLTTEEAAALADEDAAYADLEELS
jgi:RHS repeat-associated protein